MPDPSLAHSARDNEKTEDDTLKVEEPDTHRVADEADETVAGHENPNPISDFLDFQEYRIPNVVVNRLRKTLYQTNSENLVERQDIRLQGFEWVLQWSWANTTDVQHTRTETVQEGLIIREGQETEQNFGVSASFRGLGINAGGYRKDFTERETSRLVTVERRVTIPANTTIYFYQKRYTFETTVWFWQHVPGWANYNHFRIGANGTYQLVQRTAVTSIYAQEYATLTQRLTGTTSTTAQSAPQLSGEPTSTRQFVNITQRAKNELARFGIRG